MSEQFPEHIIQMYQKRIHDTYLLLKKTHESLPLHHEDCYQGLKTNIHKLVGIAGYFEDAQLAAEGRVLNALFKENPKKLPDNQIPLLTQYQKTLQNSPYFKT
jgi:hypothetical protein